MTKRETIAREIIWEILDDEPYLNTEEILDIVAEEMNCDPNEKWLIKLVKKTNFRDIDE